MPSVIWVLMWKHWQVRKNCKIRTLFLYFLLPTVPFIILFICKRYLRSIDMSKVTLRIKSHRFSLAGPREELGDDKSNLYINPFIDLTRTRLPELEDYETITQPKRKEITLIIYNPATPSENVLMDLVGSHLNLRRLNDFPDANSVGIYGLEERSNPMLYMLIKNLEDNAAVIIFQHLNVIEHFPMKLNYTIKMKIDFMTHEYKPKDEKEYKPHIKYGEIYKPFLDLQWAIDSSYLKLMTNRTLPTSIQLEEFPFKATIRDPPSMIILKLVQVAMSLSILPIFYLLLTEIVQDRSTGAEELLKICGVSKHMSALAQALTYIPIALMYAITGSVLTKITSQPLIISTSGMFLFSMMFSYFATIIAFMFACCNMTSQIPNNAVNLSLAVMLGIQMVATSVYTLKMSKYLRTTLGLLPHFHLLYMMYEMTAAEAVGKGYSFTNMSMKMVHYPGYSFFIFCLVQIMIYAAIAWYSGQVFGGPTGIGQPYNFLCKAEFWSKKPQPEIVPIREERSIFDMRYFEQTPENAEVGIQIINVSKIYGINRAVNHVTFEVLKGEITILLGHNGAGKTTLMSIITGLVKPTEGNVYVSGIDVSEHPKRARRDMGFCYQHNVFIKRLTLLQQVQLFAMLKGLKKIEAEKSSKNLLQRLGLESKANSQSQELSGGMKRRLQLACALAGNTKVLILDEPTSGLDVETRRELWDILLSLRGEHTVLLTTHHMEEADALGDRVAAMHAGYLRCYATPLFLKKQIGTGYRITLTTFGRPDFYKIDTFTNSIIPSAHPVKKTYNSLTYSVPIEESSKFPDFFAQLESRRTEFMIDSIGVGVSTLEEVFLKVCSDVADPLADEPDNIYQITGTGPTQPLVTGNKQHFRVFMMLITRNIRYFRNIEIIATVMALVFPLVLIILATVIVTLDVKNANTSENKRLLMNLDIYSKIPERKVLYKVDNWKALRTVSLGYDNVQFLQAPNIPAAILRTREENLYEYSKYLVGVDMNKTTAKLLYTTTVRHAAPVALNLLSNILAAEFTRSDGKAITTYNEPLDRPVMLDESRVIHATDIGLVTIWALLVNVAMFTYVDKQIDLPVTESLSGSRQNHMMAGCSPFIHWVSKLVFSTALYVLFLIAPMLALILCMENNETLNKFSCLGTLFLILVLGCMACLSLAYTVCFGMSKTVTLLIVLVFNVGGLFSTILYAEISKFRPGFLVERIFDIIYCVLPVNTLFQAILNCMKIARANAFCNRNRSKCPSFNAEGYTGFNLYKCCVEGKDPLSYFGFHKTSPLKEIAILIGQILVYMTIVVLKQIGVFNDIREKILNYKYVPKQNKYQDEEVKKEKLYVDNQIKLPAKQIEDALLLWNVHKRYWRCMSFTNFVAVSGISLSVKKGECFGLLGVNGAGKSTTFKMIACEIAATRGLIFGNKHFLKRANTDYLRSFGYCPQFFGVDEFMTGSQNLSLILTMKGYCDEDVQRVSYAWISVVGLESHSNKQVSGYSGGCKRRITAAWALCGNNAIALLDEPTAGVDVAARRRVWTAMRTGLQHGQSIVITSHSMDEMEALCNRITILSRGEMAALGSAPALRAAHAKGYGVVFKLISSAKGDDAGREAEVARLKEYMLKTFTCELKDEHKTMIRYHLNVTMLYSELFAALESIKTQFAHLIEDYAASETTLEEVFLSYAEQNKNSVNEQI